MAVPDRIAEARDRYLAHQGICDLGTGTVYQNNGTLSGTIPCNFRQTYEIGPQDDLRAFGDFDHGVLMLTPAEFAEVVR